MKELFELVNNVASNIPSFEIGKNLNFIDSSNQKHSVRKTE